MDIVVKDVCAEVSTLSQAVLLLCIYFTALLTLLRQKLSLCFVRLAKVCQKAFSLYRKYQTRL